MDDSISLHRADRQGNPLGEWGLRVSGERNADADMIQAYNIETICNKFDIQEIDILKIDVEGAELELFSMGQLSWIARVKMIIVETHDRFRPGSENAVRDTLGKDFTEIDRRGENLFFGRKADQ
jgi:hypothetical protein